FLLFFLTFAGLLLGATGATENPQTGEIALEPYKYLHNLMALPMVAVLLLGGVVAVLWGLGVGLFRGSRNGFWWSGAGTVAVVLALLLLAGYNHTAYYRSTVDLQSSLTIANSSSSKFTLSVMAWVSLFIPVVVFYLGYVWRAMNRSRLNEEELEQESDHSY
ncbi:MAG: cytochrome d ubiquinol oxidase subunit II, partial [Alistipes sp.]|nr:cytochrome d ubiquinol oxidase subunit II [Alistipes sp.]